MYNITYDCVLSVFATSVFKKIITDFSIKIRDRKNFIINIYGSLRIKINYLRI